MRSYPALWTPKPFEIDGDLKKPAWEAAPWSDDFVDIEGDARPAPKQRTRMKMLWGEQGFYIAALLEETQIWGTLTERESVIFHDNDFEFFLDPDADGHNYVEFEINALGTEWDLLLPKPYRNGGLPLTGWDFKGIQSAVKIDGAINDPNVTSTSWSVEIFVPWTSVQEICRCACPPKPKDQWRINFSRVEWDVDVVDGRFKKVPKRPEHNWVWSPQGVVDMHRPEKWGIVQFCPETSGTPAIQRDFSLDARDRLFKVYESARDYRTIHGTWPTTTDVAGVCVYSTPDLIELITEAEDEHGVTQKWHLSGDGFVWMTN